MSSIATLTSYEEAVRRGAEFEMLVLGVTACEEEDFILTHLKFEESMSEVINQNLIACDDSLLDGEIHHPLSPNLGMTREIWSVVRNFLPRRAGGMQSGPLSFYIAVGTDLDYRHGVDAFLCWEGVWVTLDMSTALKSKRGWGRHRLKADLLFGPGDIETNSLLDLGEKIAQLLKTKRLKRRTQDRRNNFTQNSAEEVE